MPDFSVDHIGAEDVGALSDLYRRAFPEEDLTPLLRALLAAPEPVLSLAARTENAIIGHIAFTDCRLADEAERPVLLGPLAVTPEQQRRGVGSALIGEGLARLERAGATHIFVLGDPAYYGRFGFEREERISTPHPIPAEWRDAWRSLGLGGQPRARDGALNVPAPWDHPELWAPA